MATVAVFASFALASTMTQAAGFVSNGNTPASTSTFGADNAMAPNFKAASTSIKTDAVTDPTTKFKALQTTSQDNGQTQLGTDAGTTYTWIATPTGMEIVPIKAPAKNDVTKVKDFVTATTMKKVINGETGGDIAQQNKAVFGTSVGFLATQPPVTMKDLLKSVAYLDLAKQPAPYFDLSVSRGVRRT